MGERSVQTDLAPWDIVTDPANPQPNMWPVCTWTRDRKTCNTPWVWRHGWRFTNGDLVSTWGWMRDCKHKSGAYELHTKNGKCEAVES